MVEYESVKTEKAIRELVRTIADVEGKLKYRVWRDVICIVYNNLDDKLKETVKKRLEKKGIRIEDFIQDET